MAKPTAKAGRTTPKGGRATPKGTPAKGTSGRYTPPIPKEYRESPRWVAVLMFSLLIIGMLLIVVNYLGVLPGGASNWYLLVGLGSITAGFIAATRLR
jgi:hypothetical protein